MKTDFTKTDDFEALEALREEWSFGNKKAYILPLGCQQNEADSEKMRGMLSLAGCTFTDAPEDADVIIMNTCAIREHAELKALSLLGNFKILKRENPELVVGVVGCMAAEPKRVEMIKGHFSYVDFTLEPSMIHKLPSVILKTVRSRKRTFVFDKDDGSLVEGVPVKRVSKYKAWVSIMYGCNNFCTYCIVPYVRGRERSRDSAEIIAECRELVRTGIKEITLLGQNVNSYNADMNFAALISEIAKIDGEFIIRFMTSHPKDVSPELIEAMRIYKGKIAPAFHLPLQSGSNEILKAMHRTYTREKYLDTVRALRAAVPDITLSTDVIVGFPGESDEDFEDTMGILAEVRFDMLYSFLYSPRTGTKAALLENRVEKSVMDERMKRLLDLQRQIAKEKNEPLVGKTLRVLVEESKKDEDGIYTGRADSGKLVRFFAAEDCVGTFKQIKIERAELTYLVGALTEEK